MKIEIKNIKTFEEMSEETNCFTASIYVNGKKCGRAKNEGCGGPTSYFEEFNGSLIDAENHCKTLPAVVYKTTSFPMNLEFFIDEAVDEYLRKKDMLKGLIYGDDMRYQLLTWKSHDISTLLRSNIGISLLKANIKRLQGEGKTILNTNLPADLF